MSKTSLRKELKAFTSEQLIELIMEVYSARKEAKEYFEFFLDPDVDKLREKYLAVIKKEFHRMKHREITPRWTKIRGAIKDFDSFNPGAEHVVRLMNTVFTEAVGLYKTYNCHYTMVSGISVTLGRLLDYGDKHQVLDLVIDSVIDIVVHISTSDYVSRQLRQSLISELNARKISVD